MTVMTNNAEAPMPRGRPRKPLVGGHKSRRPQPTEHAQLNAALRDMESPRPKRTPRKAKESDMERTQGKDGKLVVRLKKGHTLGRPQGSKNKVPGKVRASVAAILRRVVKEKDTTVERAIVDGIESGPRHADRYLRLAAEYVDGKPVDTVNLNAQFNQSELKAARTTLGAKLDAMLVALTDREEKKK